MRDEDGCFVLTLAVDVSALASVHRAQQRAKIFTCGRKERGSCKCLRTRGEIATTSSRFDKSSPMMLKCLRNRMGRSSSRPQIFSRGNSWRVSRNEYNEVRHGVSKMGNLLRSRLEKSKKLAGELPVDPLFHTLANVKLIDVGQRGALAVVVSTDWFSFSGFSSGLTSGWSPFSFSACWMSSSISCGMSHGL